MKKDFGLQSASDQAPHWGKKAENGVKYEKISTSEINRARFFFFFFANAVFFPFPHNAEPGPTLDYSQTEKTMNTKNISGMLLCCERKTNQT